MLKGLLLNRVAAAKELAQLLQESRQELSSQRMLAPRPTRLRSQRDINLWRIPLKLSLAAVGLFAITLIPDILDKCGIIHIPWLTMGSIDDALCA